jgi:enoyl-CoA hydratase/carnithine racemase
MTRGRYFLLTGQKISAEQALEMGIVNELLPREQLMSRAFALAGELASQPPLAVRYTRVALNMMLKNMLGDSLSHGLALEGLGIIENQRPRS